jgi:hypothetical protein
VNKVEISPNKHYIIAGGNPQLKLYEVAGTNPQAVIGFCSVSQILILILMLQSLTHANLFVSFVESFFFENRHMNNPMFR